MNPKHALWLLEMEDTTIDILRLSHKHQNEPIVIIIGRVYNIMPKIFIISIGFSIRIRGYNGSFMREELLIVLVLLLHVKAYEIHAYVVGIYSRAIMLCNMGAQSFTICSLYFIPALHTKSIKKFIILHLN